jgi:hypothetical protein
MYAPPAGGADIAFYVGAHKRSWDRPGLGRVDRDIARVAGAHT